MPILYEAEYGSDFCSKCGPQRKETYPFWIHFESGGKMKIWKCSQCSGPRDKETIKKEGFCFFCNNTGETRAYFPGPQWSARPSQVAIDQWLSENTPQQRRSGVGCTPYPQPTIYDEEREARHRECERFAAQEREAKRKEAKRRREAEEGATGTQDAEHLRQE